MSGCSVFGKESVEIAPYSVLEKEGAFEIRTYERMILVSTTMKPGIDTQKDGSFGRLFDFITGANVAQQDIAMTAPVFMDNKPAASKDLKGQEIPMTAPVFMENGAEPVMSFVMPADFTMDTTPIPTDDSVKVSEISDYTVATVQFSGWLNEENTAVHEALLREWLAGKPGYQIIGTALTAGYNPPWTLPMYRRNEVLIPVEKK